MGPLALLGHRRLGMLVALLVCAASVVAFAGDARPSAAGVPAQTTPEEQTDPAVAFDGTNYLVVWKGFSLDTKTGGVFAARVSPSGTVLDPDGIEISSEFTGELAPFAPAVAFDGADYLVTWTENRGDPFGDLYGARITPAGTLLDPDGF